jgi:hypothetical protein
VTEKLTPNYEPNPAARTADRLPPGLDPVAAGRWGLWLLGNRSHNRSIGSQTCPPLYGGDRIIGHVYTQLAPWKRFEYPGRIKYLADVLGVSRETARKYSGCQRDLPPKHALRLADYLEAKAIRLKELAEALRSEALQRQARQRRDRRIWLYQGRATMRLRRIQQVRDAHDARIED